MIMSLNCDSLSHRSNRKHLQFAFGAERSKRKHLQFAFGAHEHGLKVFSARCIRLFM